MFKNRKRLQQMISRNLAGKSSRAEREFLEAYDDLFQRDITGPEILSGAESEIVEKRLEKNLLNIIETGTRKKIVPLWTRIAVAASICMVFATGGYFLLNQQKKNRLSTQNSRQILPGSDKAILLLANGSQISLADAKNGQIAAQGDVNVIKGADGSITYQVDGSEIQANLKTSLNTISIPNGGQYRVTLPDGSKVWLNAASSLSFPVSFDHSNQREVTLKGEAYFEVAKDKLHPFIVKTATQQVQVLGTHFNIKAYDDEPSTMTTLLEGSVQVQNGSQISKLVPGQQSNLSDGKLLVKNVIAEDAIAWKEGYFRFNDESIDAALRKIARWYDVTIVYTDNDVKDKTAYGTMSRFSSIEEVVQLLELTKAARFKIKGDKIIVSRYTD
jgi:transmembrane sensor